MPISAYDNINYAQYSPISMQEMWAPAAMLREQHDKLQEDYSNAEQAAQQGFSGLNPEVDKEALAIHKQFMDQTKAAADELATKGFIDAGRRRNLLQLKSVYSNQIAPYQQQIALRASRADELRKLQMTDRSYKATVDPMSISLDKGIKNPNAYNYAGVSGEKVYKDTAQAMEQVKQVAAQELPRRVSSGLLNQYYTLQKHGLQPDEAAKVMAQNSENDAQRQTWSKIGKLTLDAIHGSLSRNGVYDVFKDKPEVINEFWKNATDAAVFGLGQTQVGTMTDEMQMYKDKKALENQQQQQQNLASDVNQSPLIANNPKFQELNKDLDILNQNRGYVNTKKYSNSKEAEAMIKERQRLQTAPIDTKNESVMSRMQQLQNLNTQIQTKHPDYEYSKQLEDIAKKYGGKTVGDIRRNIVQQIEHKKLLLSDQYLKDSEGTITKSAFNNIRLNTSALEALKNADSKFDINKYDVKDFRIGHGFDGTPIVSFVGSNGKVTRVEMPHEIVGNPNSIRILNPNEHSKLYKGMVSGNVDINTNALIKNNDGTYSIAGFDYSNVKDKNIQTKFTKQELNDGLENPSIRYLMDKKTKQISTMENAGLSSTNKFEPIKI